MSIDRTTAFTHEELAADLQLYFDGLTQSAAGTTQVVLTRKEPAGFAGTTTIFDSFFT